MMRSNRVISAWPRDRLRTRWLRISAPCEASQESDADIAKDRGALAARFNRWGQTDLHFGTVKPAGCRRVSSKRAEQNRIAVAMERLGWHRGLGGKKDWQGKIWWVPIAGAGLVP